MPPREDGLIDIQATVNTITTKVAVLEEIVPRIEDQVKLVNGKVDTVIKILQGNSKDGGLVTTVSNNRNSIKRIWWWLGGVSLTILTLVATYIGYAGKVFK